MPIDGLVKFLTSGNCCCRESSCQDTRATHGTSYGAPFLCVAGLYCQVSTQACAALSRSMSWLERSREMSRTFPSTVILKLKIVSPWVDGRDGPIGHQLLQS